MRIIDKNTDFYDYLQNIYRDNSTTFDRTDSFVLTKDLMCEYFSVLTRWRSDDRDRYRFVLLQVCNTFWLFLFEITDKNDYGIPTNYKVELLTTWKNYSKQRRLNKLDVISFGFAVSGQISTSFWRYDRATILKKVDVLTRAIDQNDFKVIKSIDHHTIFHGTNVRTEKHLPLLKACGIGNCIDPLDIYLSFEEYFSLERQSQERIASVGLTDKEKIENHGFDAKVSFRGKGK